MSRGAVAFLALVLAAGCAPIESPTPIDSSAAGLERWKCGDWFDGCGVFGTKCHVTLTANLETLTGTVSFDGITEHTEFQIRGIERRWDWCLADDDRFDCAFVISPDGRARYYNFATNVPDPDGATRAKPTDLFKCTRS